ncbi:putative cyclin-dependent kinase F-2 [Panicum hallii]|jgi:cell division cycle 2-like|uniref:putative cyclin-dependent kinase F-2 n=1 Tax=Panicum hallii TaxID=206008 RepID=UPI000DF4E6A4|nr:putative cyclin-dependent kinase F-2 [Panicum hallii]
MAACVPFFTEGELLVSRQRRQLCARSAAPEDASSVPSAAGAATARNDQRERICRLDSFKRLKQIGEGAFGTVSKARDRRTGEVVAIKSARNGSSEAAAALLREAALLAACAGNPAVVALREVARSEPAGLHLVMDFVGPSLHDIISARRRHDLRFTESEARRAMAQLLAGVGSMHAYGIVHRDLKPGNVLVGEHDRRLKICDLGLATSTAAPPRDAQIEGTLGYIAPEALVCQKDCGGPADMWALGCIMAELVGGEKLFPEDDEYSQLVSIVDLLGIPDQVSLIA